MLINVAFDGRKLFDWEGDAKVVSAIDEEVRSIAKRGKVTPEQLSHSTIVTIQRNGGRLFTPKPEAEMMIVIWHVLSMPTGDPKRPGHYRDYLEAWNFDFDIHVEPETGKLDIGVNGMHTAKGTA